MAIEDQLMRKFISAYPWEQGESNRGKKLGYSIYRNQTSIILGKLVGRPVWHPGALLAEPRCDGALLQGATMNTYSI